MDIKTFLEQAFCLDLSIKIRMEEIEELESKIQYTNIILKSDYVIKTPTTTKEDLICKVIDFKERIEKDMIRLIELKTQIYNLIQKSENVKYRALLFQRFVLFKTWAVISEEMGYEDRHTMRLYKKALNELEIYYEDICKEGI